MKKTLVGMTALMLLASCGNKSTTNSDGLGTAHSAQAYKYELEEDVALRVLKLMGDDALPNGLGGKDYMYNLILRTEESGVRGPFAYDNIELDRCTINCLKRRDGNFLVIHQLFVQQVGYWDITATNFFILDGDRLTPAECPLASSIKASDVVDEFDNWMYSLMPKGEDTTDISDLRNLKYEVRQNDDGTRSVAVKMAANIGGCWLSWNGEELTATDEVCTRTYNSPDDGILPGFEWSKPLPEMPEMQSYKLQKQDDSSAFLERNGEKVLEFKLEDGKLSDIVPLTELFGEHPGEGFKIERQFY